MDFLKNNLFYVILVAAVLLVSIPSYILASQKQARNRQALTIAQGLVDGMKVSVQGLKVYSDAALAAARSYNEEWLKQKNDVVAIVEKTSKHLNDDFLVQPARPGDIPDAEAYKTAYNAAYDKLIARLKGMYEKEQPLPEKAKFGDKRPTPTQIRISQRQYWIVKELVDLFTDPALGVKAVRSVKLDYVPNRKDGTVTPKNDNTFWVYPMELDFQIDFRTFPVFLQKLIDDPNVMFFPDGYRVARAFDETSPVYVPTVAVVMYCEVWHYISSTSAYDKNELQAYLQKKPAAARRGQPGAPRAPRPAGIPAVPQPAAPGPAGEGSAAGQPPQPASTEEQ